VEVQVDVSARGSPGFNIVGLAGKSIRESRERIRAAIRNSGLRFPHQHRVLVNLAPASEEKEGAGFDLAVALGILFASRQIRLDEVGKDLASGETLLESTGFLGELGLNGELRPVPGALLTADALKSRGVSRIVVAKGNAEEAALVEGLEVFPAADLHQALAALRGKLLPVQRRNEGEGGPDLPGRETGSSGPSSSLSLSSSSCFSSFSSSALSACAPKTLDFADVRGQEATKRGLLVSASGEHNALLVGPPGVGKTMLARRLPGILPPMIFSEAMEVTRIASALGQGVRSRLEGARPFRAPHHTISYAGLVGGGSRLRPGEVTRSHRGVLFLDELPEFSRRALEALREPIEEGHITLGRGSGSLTFPARFLLLAAMNPCPCGYLGQGTGPGDHRGARGCACSHHAVRAYRQRISGPLLDRFDLFLAVKPVKASDLLGRPGPQATPEGPQRRTDRQGNEQEGLGSDALREQVSKARKIQAGRWGPGEVNAHVSLARLLSEGSVRSEVLDRLRLNAERLSLSARGFVRCLRVARTVADLEGSPSVEPRHLSEALHYRQPG
jgi:magnesium chelatase family protein